MTLFNSPQGRDLELQASRLREQRIASMLSEDPGRSDSLSCVAAGLHLDFSRHLLDADTLDLLLVFARGADISDRIEALFDGQQVNTTEGRPALHTLLRASDASGTGDRTRFDQVAASRDRMRERVVAQRA